MSFYEPEFRSREETIAEKLDRLISRFEEEDEKKSKKKFNLPLGMKMSSNSKIRKGYVLVILLRTNGQIEIKFLPVISDMIRIPGNETFHLSSTRYVFRYKKYPVIILPEWSLEPICPKLNYMKTLEEGKISWPQKVIINAVKLAQEKQKKSIGGFVWILIIGAVIVGLYLILSKFIK